MESWNWVIVILSWLVIAGCAGFCAGLSYMRKQNSK